MANLAHNYNKNVIAVYLVGNVEPTNRNCWDKANTTIPHLGPDKSKFLGYAIQTSCSEIQDALNKNVKGIKKGECITLKGLFSVLSTLPGATATTCPIGCSEGKQFLPKQEVSVNDLTEAFGITFVGQSEEESMTCDNLYSHVKQASSYGMPYSVCQAFTTAAVICCVTRGKKKGKPFGD